MYIIWYYVLNWPFGICMRVSFLFSLFSSHFWNTLSMTKSIRLKTGLRESSRYEKNVSVWFLLTFWLRSSCSRAVGYSIWCGGRIAHKNRLSAQIPSEWALSIHNSFDWKLIKSFMNSGCGCYQRAKSFLLLFIKPQIVRSFPFQWLLFYRLHQKNWRGIYRKECYQIKIDKHFVFVWLFNHLNNNNEIAKSLLSTKSLTVKF